MGRTLGGPADGIGAGPTSTHYERLGIRPSASTEEVRRAYLDLARRLHPDRLVDPTPAERALAERRMREINEAWRVLQVRESRDRYDESLRPARARSAAPRQPATSASGSPSTSPSAAAGVGSPERYDDWEHERWVDATDDEPIGLVGELLRHLPWVVLVGALLLIFVVTAYASAGHSSSPTPTTVPGPASPGTCLDVSPGPATTIVPCAGHHDVTVVARVDEQHACPSGTERRRLAHDGLLDCVTTP
ncbi:MAG TPA: DnaJ domain-containing protein [Acidimicrobiales bacterium]